MPDEARIRGFLKNAGWGTAVRTDLAGDASSRRYERLRLSTERHAVLMIARESESTLRFVEISRALLSAGFSAPEIFAVDDDGTLVLMEDLGDTLFARRLSDNAAEEPTLYEAACDLLLVLHDIRLPGSFPVYGSGTLAEAVEPAATWYARVCADNLAAGFAAALEDVDGLTDVVALRDFHAENLIWLPDRSGIRRVGLLDFQDAVLSHRTYDLASLLDDARRDVDGSLRAHILKRYIASANVHVDDFEYAFSLLGAQRNLRIMGVFARLSRQDGKARYLELIPRVWRHLMRELSHPALGDLRDMILDIMPPPTDAHLASLKPDDPY